MCLAKEMLLKRLMKNDVMFRIIIFFVCGLLCVQCLVAQSSKYAGGPGTILGF